MNNINPYINLTTSLIGQPGVNYLKKCASESYKGIKVPRLAAIGMAAGSMLTGVADTFIGLGASAASIVTLGQNKEARLQMANHMNSTDRLLSRTYKSLLKTINPSAQFTDKAKVSSTGQGGILTNFVRTKLDSAITATSNSKNFFVKHVVSRGVALAKIPASIAARVVDLAIGVFGMLGSIFTLGKWESANNLAQRGLQITGIVSDVLGGIVQTLNPQGDMRMGFHQFDGSIQYIDMNKPKNSSKPHMHFGRA